MEFGFALRRLGLIFYLRSSAWVCFKAFGFDFFALQSFVGV